MVVFRHTHNYKKYEKSIRLHVEYHWVKKVLPVNKIQPVKHTKFKKIILIGKYTSNYGQKM